jgi:dolichyl-phosphate beta-glucosyltransferase
VATSGDGSGTQHAAGRESPALSIVIPAYDERNRLPRTLESVAKHLRSEDLPSEVVIVDDGSSDGTPDVARAEGERLGLPLRVLSHAPNRGKGFAVRRGMLEARGAEILLTDADESVPIASLDRFRARLREGADAVIGSRQTHGAHIAIHQARVRERLGGVFRNLSRVLVPGTSDFTCGFKLFRREAAQRIFARQQLWGWGYDVEILLIARRLGVRVVEEPVEWSDDAQTRVRLGVDVLRSALDLARVAWNDRRGRYGASDPAR